MYQPLKGVSLLLVTISLTFSTFMYVLDYSIANVAIPHIAGDLAVSNEQGTYIITAFAVGNAIALPMTGWITKQLGAVKVHVLSTLLFTFFSWLCGLSFNYQMLVLNRFFQGVVTGPLLPLTQTLLIQSFSTEKKSLAMSLFGNVAILGPVVGPILGGWITFNYYWPWIFYINIPVGIASAIITWTILKNRDTPIEKFPLDKIGLLLLAIGVSSLQILLDKGHQYGWFEAPFIRTLAVISFVSLTLMVVWQFLVKYPILNFRLMKIHSFTVSLIILVIIYGSYFGTLVLVPLWLQSYMNYNAVWAGLAVAPLGVIPLIFTSQMPKLIQRFGCLNMLFLCFIGIAGACFYTSYFNTEMDFLHIAFSRFLLGIGLLFFIGPVLSMSVQDIPQERLPNSTGLFHFLRTLSAGVGTSMFVSLWLRRGIIHHSNLIPWVNNFSENSREIIQKTEHLGFEGQQSLDVLNRMVDQQAYTLAQNDVAYLVGWICIFLIFLLPFGRKDPFALPAPIKKLFQRSSPKRVE